MNRYSVIAMVIAIALFTTGSVLADSHTPEQTVSQQTAPSEDQLKQLFDQYVQDNEITATIKNELSAIKKFPTADIHVITIEGKVFLSGSVETAHQFEQVATLVEKVPGVKSITNDILVKP